MGMAGGMEKGRKGGLAGEERVGKEGGNAARVSMDWCACGVCVCVCGRGVRNGLLMIIVVPQRRDSSSVRYDGQ